MGVSAKLYAVAFLLVAALAFQAGGGFRIAASLSDTADRLVHNSLDATARAERIQELLTSHRRVIERAAASERPIDVMVLVAAHRTGMKALHALLESEATGSAEAEATLRQLLYNLAEFNLTGGVVLDDALALLSDRPDLGAIELGTIELGAPGIAPAALQRGLLVFAVAADRIGEDIQQWRQDRWRAALNEAEDMLRTINGAAQWARVVGLAITALGLLGLLVLRGVLRQIGGITGAVLRVARHERDITIPGRDDPGPIGDIARAVAILADDVRELERRGIAQAATSHLLDAALNSMTQGLVTTGADGRLQIFNQRFAAMLGLPEHTLVAGMAIRDALAQCHDSIAAALAPPAEPQAGSHQSIVALDGALVIRARWVRMRDGGWLGTFDDITRIQRTEAQLVHLARHDPLTDRRHCPRGGHAGR